MIFLHNSLLQSFPARRPTGRLSFLFKISVNTDKVLCIVFVFYQRLIILLYFNVLTSWLQLSNTRINAYETFVERKNWKGNLSAICRHFRKTAKSDYYLNRVRPYETYCLGWTDFHEIWYMSFVENMPRGFKFN
jgi:hypothetical protein